MKLQPAQAQQASVVSNAMIGSKAIQDSPSYQVG